MKFDIHYLFSPKYAKWIILCLITLFSLLILSEVVQFFVSVNKKPALSKTPVPAQNSGQESFNDILNSSLFGVYVPNDLNEDNVKKSMLNVNLVGIMLADKIEDSQVIIRGAGGDEKTYGIGDEIPGGALIKRIMTNGVLVERNGTLESLSLPKNELIFEPVAKPLLEEQVP
ncbi:MAG: type II secretion system protein N [Legionella sp.]|nr:type II secretion system protein N [Legionella sp.]